MPESDGLAVATGGTDTAASVVCQNCGSQVAAQYARVWTPEGQAAEGPRTCPNCSKVRERDGTVRDPRNVTGGGDDA